MDMIFKDGYGKSVGDVAEYVSNHIKSYPNSTFDVIVGGDSQQHGRELIYVTVIAMIRFGPEGRGKGHHIIRCTEIVPMIKDFYTKMWGEVQRIVDTAVYLNESIVKDVLGKGVESHYDFNDSPEYNSNSLHDSALGYAKGMGLKAFGKPYAIIASHVADHYCKHPGFKTRTK